MKKGYKIVTAISLILIVVLSLFLIAGTGGSKETTKKEKILVGMATDVGGLGDKSFNDGCFNGLLKAKEEFGVETRVVESKQ